MTQSDQQFARQAADLVIRRDRRRIRLLAGVTIALWVLAALVLPAFYLPLWAKVNQHLVGLTQRPADSPALTPQDVADKLGPLAEMGMIVGGVIMGLTLLTEILAAISTVALALTIRRVTLRQVTDGLADVSEQLRQLGGRESKISSPSTPPPPVPPV